MTPIVFTRNRLVALLALTILGLFAFQLWYQAVRSSTTIDEPIHILAGHRYWQCSDFGINPEHPPLAKLVAAAALNFRAWIEPSWGCGSRMTPPDEGFVAARTFLTVNGMDGIVFSTRLAAASLSVLLAVLVFLAALEMFGRSEALTALALLAFEPNLIAHGALVTTDMALVATAFGAAYALYRFRIKPNVGNFLIISLALGLMLAAKHSAVIFVPVFFGLLVADVTLFHQGESRLGKQLLGQSAVFAGLICFGVIVLWAFYGFRYSAIPNASESTASAVDYFGASAHASVAKSLAAKAFSCVSYTRILPEAYLVGLADVMAMGSRKAFIFDRSYATGQWFYFPLAFLVKSSVALLLLLPLGLVLPVFNPEKRRAMMFLLVPPLVFFAVSLTSKLNIGVRHILPIYPFLIVAAAAGAVAFTRRVQFFRYVVFGLLLFHAATSLFRVAPHYLAFSNDFWGGVNKTHRVFPGDSNTEWGQNDKLVAEYLARENITDCWYAPYQYGDVLPAALSCRLLPGTFVSNQRLLEPIPPVIEGTVLLSTTVLPPRGSDNYLPIAQSKPIAQIGGSVFVYQGRFAIPLASSLSYVTRSEELTRLQHFEEAAADARRAIEIAPETPRPHLALGIALARLGRTAAARGELETAIRLMESNPALYRDADRRGRQELERLK